MPNTGYFDSVTNIAQSGGTISTATAGVDHIAGFAGTKSNIQLTSAGAIAVNTGGTFARFATVEDQLTDIPLTASGQVINTSRINKWFYGAGYGRV